MTKNAFVCLILFLLLGASTAGCFGCFGSDDEASSETVAPRASESDEDNTEADPPENLTDAMNQAQNALQDALCGEGGAGGKVKESVDFRKLRDLLPDEVDGLDRTSAEGERGGAFGIQVSTATGEYEDGDEWIKISIADLGTLTGLARVGYTTWLQAEVDRENDRGFERTRTFSSGGEDYPSFEKFEGEGDRGSCEIQVWVAERFVVSVEGRNVEMEQCEEARDEISYRQLDRMKDEGTEEE